jgi:penicillin-binding protein 1A
VFANGGYRVNPWLITKITDQRGNTLLETQPTPLTESTRVITERNAFLMERLLNEVTRAGTAAKAQALLKRIDLYGKTGTTNDSVDTWFAGFQPTLCAVVWMGYDAPRSLGDRETGGGLSLPIWISFMETALKDVPVSMPIEPDGVISVAGDWYFEEYPPAARRELPRRPATAASAPDQPSSAPPEPDIPPDAPAR